MEQVSVAQRTYMENKRKHKQSVRAFRFFILLLFILAWELSTRFKLIDSFIFSSPSRIVNTFLSMWKDGSIFLHTGITLTETIASFLLVLVLSVFISVILWLKPKLSEISEPYLIVLNSLPKSALAPLLIVWLGANMKTIIVAGISVAIFGSVISLYTGFREISDEKIKLIYTLGGTKKDALYKVVLPATIPTLISTSKVNIGLCLVGVVIGEFLAARNGLGYLIIYGSQVFKLDWVLMSIVILCIIAILLYFIIQKIEKKCQKLF